MPEEKMPRSVLVASDALYFKFAGDPEAIHLLEGTDAMVVPYSTSPHFNDQEVLRVREHLSRTGQLAAGSLLIKSPYDSESFEVSENAIATFAVEKYRAMAKVAALLGASEIKFEQARIETANSKWSANLNTRFKVGGGKAEAKRDVRKHLTSRLDSHLKFRGGSPSPDEARAHLVQRNIFHDRELAALIDLRTDPNRVEHYQMTISGSLESESNLQCALDLANAGPVKLLQIGATFARTVNVVMNIEISTTIEFPAER